MKTEITEKEWEFIQCLRNFRKARHNPSWQIEIYLDSLYETLKEEDEGQ